MPAAEPLFDRASFIGIPIESNDWVCMGEWVGGWVGGWVMGG